MGSFQLAQQLYIVCQCYCALPANSAKLCAQPAAQAVMLWRVWTSETIFWVFEVQILDQSSQRPGFLWSREAHELLSTWMHHFLLPPLISKLYSLFRPKLTSVPSDTSPNSLRLSDLTCFLSPAHKKQLQIWYISYDTRKEHYKGWQSPCLSLLAFYGLLLLGWPSPMVYSFCQSFCWIQLWYTYLCLLVPWFPLKI